jgi:acetyltransferase-like isoleucine patch superfamily enzyme
MGTFRINPAPHERALAVEDEWFGSVGAHTYGQVEIHRWGDEYRVTIGKFCSLAHVDFYIGENHRIDWCSTYPFMNFAGNWPTAEGLTGHPSCRGDIRVGNDVWIGDRAMILSGVTIGDGAVVAAGALVTRDVAPYQIVGGNPAKPIRLRFPEEQVRRLLAIRWWDWPDDLIRRHVATLCSGDLARLEAIAHGQAAAGE